MALITRFLFKEYLAGTQGTGGTAISEAVDLRDATGTTIGLTYTIASTNGTAGAGTAGSATFEYQICPVFDGTYYTPINGTIGTAGDGSVQRGGFTITPIPVPFMKIKAVVGTSNPAVITAALHFR